MIISIEEEHIRGNANITVIGVGGGGGNAVNRMVEAGIKGVDFIAANTDAQALKDSSAGIRIQLGEGLTKGLGAGGDPTVGEKAAQEDLDTIKDALKGSDMVFVTAGCGGGTGTGGAPIIASVAKELGILTVGVVTKPFMFEGKKRHQRAVEGVEKLRKNVDTLLVIPNQRLFAVIREDTAAVEAFKVADDVLRQAVQSISDIITSKGLINVDFADVKSVMQNAGDAIMGLGYGEGEDRALKAARNAITSPLLEDVSIEGAEGLLVNVTGNQGMTLHEINAAMELIHSSVSPEADVFFGHTIDNSLERGMKITVIATGCRKKGETKPPEMEKKHFIKEGHDKIKEKMFPSYLRRIKKEN
ncbi:MAG: cell division protein FtsZ [Elusimicrobia bacterium]|nr:cell division protein FtsZ [Elusimicrobiota bacterium]